MPEKTVVRWKACRKLDDGSLVSGWQCGECEVTYRVGRYVRAPVGGLLVFKTRAAARKLGTSCKVKCRGRMELPKRAMVLSPVLTLAEARKTWEGPVNRGLAWPPGTEAYREVMILPQKRKRRCLS